MQKLLSDYRKEAGFDTQERLSVIIGVDRSTIAKWESGDRCPTTLMLPRLAELLKISEGEIISAIMSVKKDIVTTA